MAQEWPPILCKKIVSGVERAVREQCVEHSWYYPVGEGEVEEVSDLICDACQQGKYSDCEFKEFTGEYKVAWPSQCPFE